MGTKKLTDFTQQAVLNYSTRLYGVPYSGLGAFTDTQVPITVMFDNTTFTGTTAHDIVTANSIAATAGTIGGSAIVTLAASQTLTNKTLTAPVISTISNSGVVTLPTGPETLVGRATTDTLTNKTLTTPTVNGATLSGTFAGTPTYSGAVTYTNTITPSQTAGIVGTTTNNNANAGSFGEYLTNSTAGTSMTTATPANATSISLTAGDWDVSGQVSFNPAGSTTMQSLTVSVSTVSATLQANGSGQSLTLVFTTGNAQLLTVAPTRISLTTTTTIFIVAQATFGVSTLTTNGFIRARRVR